MNLGTGWEEGREGGREVHDETRRTIRLARIVT